MELSKRRQGGEDDVPAELEKAEYRQKAGAY